ncbi:hypothetical protein ACVWZZ_008401 [Bradyrhizobium sp. LM6.10]
MFKDRALRLLPFLAAVAPIVILFCLATIALYGAPETDDFCLANHFNADGLIGTLEIYYRTLMGRLVPLALITVPAMLAKAFNLDYFVMYPSILIAGIVTFIASITLAIGRLWPGIAVPERVLVGTTLAATIAVLAISLREMFYWVSGSAPYMVPAVIVTIVLVEMVRSAANETLLSPAAIALLSLLCFLGALCNEFTPLWLIAFITASLLFRKACHHPTPQARSHLAMVAATVAGLAILLLSPGNALRMEAYPAGQKLAESFMMAAYYLWLDLWWLYDEAAARAWVLFLVIFSLLVVPARRAPTKPTLLLAAGLIVLILGCAYAAYFVAYFATGEDLATRGRNEVIVLLLVGLGCVVATSARLLPRGAAPGKRNGTVQVIALLACAAASTLLFRGRALVAVNAESSQFATFQQETMERHTLLRTTAEKSVVVPERSVKPLVLMSADLTADPSRMPNDCIAAFYGKRAVVVRAR